MSSVPKRNVFDHCYQLLPVRVTWLDKPAHSIGLQTGHPLLEALGQLMTYNRGKVDINRKKLRSKGAKETDRKPGGSSSRDRSMENRCTEGSTIPDSFPAPTSWFWGPIHVVSIQSASWVLNRWCRCTPGSHDPLTRQGFGFWVDFREGMNRVHPCTSLLSFCRPIVLCCFPASSRANPREHI